MTACPRKAARVRSQVVRTRVAVQARLITPALERERAWLVLLLGLTVLLAALCLARPAGAATAASPSGAERGETEGKMRVFGAGASCDTLDYAFADVYPVAMEELRKNDWQIQREDAASGRIVTAWKSLDHRLVKMFLGEVKARCAVDVTTLSDGRTALRIRGGLASDKDLESNPGFGAAQSTYRGASERWIARVRAALDAQAREGRISRLVSGGPAGASAALVGGPVVPGGAPADGVKDAITEDGFRR